MYYTLKDKDGKLVHVTLHRDGRLKKTVRWGWQPDGSLLIRVPKRYPKRKFLSLLVDIQNQLLKTKRRSTRRTDADLQKRAEVLNKKNFNGQVSWEAIRWVSNMNSRLGSCTRGGPTDGHIRISDKIKSWPTWVIDYIIAHEMTHRLHSNHSKEFWKALRTAYPLTDKAEGFIEGITHAKSWHLDE
ncbi:MAG: M48 family metallopeptidase [Chloroflexi bacterium]|nr:M48 family metallopeptidase [Chloroflexota bacterium]